jgi:hypothetical protein
MELSCSRFELENLAHCRTLGKHYQDTKNDRAYYGIGCTQASHIRQLNDYSIAFTPILKSNPKNYFHCDVYDNGGAINQNGIANSSQVNYRRDLFKDIWVAYKDDLIVTKQSIKPSVK